MKTRLTVGPILVAVVIGIFFADERWLSGSRPLASGLLALLAAVGWIEFAAMTGIRPGGERERGSRLLFAAGLVGTLSFHVAAWWTARAGAQGPSFEALALALVFATVVGSFAVAVVRRDFARHYRAVLETIVGVLLLGLLFSYHIRVYLGSPEPVVAAVCYFVGVKGTDIAAFLVGSTMGKHRFLAVSPKKTVEGCLGAIAWGALWFGAAGYFYAEALFPWPTGVACGIILALAAQLGDLSESLFKRTYDIKDSGALLPEFGGVLDMVDSLVFTGCIFWYLVA